MAYCSPKAAGDAGFATPAAAVVSLGLALVAGALTASAVAALRSSQAQAARTRADYELAGLQVRAGLETFAQSKSARRIWSLPASKGSAEVLAEPEAAKADLANLDTSVLAKLDVKDPGALQQRLRALSPVQAVGDGLEAADAAPAWRACARSLVSVYGLATARAKPTASPVTPALALAPPPAVSRIGEVWRVRVTADGWADDRLVRFTGDQRDPVAVIERRFYRRASGRNECDALLTG